MNDKRYICIEDRQGDTFGMFRNYTPKQWKKQAYEWADNDGWEEAEKILRMYDEEAIEYIDDMWEITLVEFKKSKEVIDYLNGITNYYQKDSWEAKWAKKLLKKLEECD